MKTSLYIMLLFVLVQNQFLKAADKSSQLWQSIERSQCRFQPDEMIAVNQAQYLQLDIDGMRTFLASAPIQTKEAYEASLIIEIPMPDGSFSRFAVMETQVMHPALAAKYPMIKTYAGKGLDIESSTIIIDVTQFGFHAMIRSTHGDIFIDPVNLQAIDTYLCYYKHDAVNTRKAEACGFDADDSWNIKSTEQIKKDIQERKSVSGGSANRSSGTTLRTYRLALACTGEYAATYGGTIPGALAGMVTSINRVTGVYEQELTIRLTLIANNDTLIFINAGTDPYTNNNGGTMLVQNQTTVTARIGSANYDIGHVFSTGGGGVAGLGVICQNSLKARGVTGLPNPVGDPFDIDYVAHEMGHQFGGNHTFNSVLSACSGNNRVQSAAYEPGSGITIMAYAGICGSDNLANNSIANFHTKSFDEIQNYTTLSSGASCPVLTPAGNNPPVSGLSNYQYYIPLNTPFKLTGAGTDPDGDTITYSFEEFESPPPVNGSAWNAPSGNAPIFRPYEPSLTEWRLFPKINNILNNLNSAGDLKPAYARNLHFRLTLRDNRNNGGGVTYDDTLVQVNVINTTVPFAITYPNVVGISWAAGSTQTITWDVAGSTAAPISTSNVNIFLSTGGAAATYPFPIPIAANVPNTGSYTFVVPNNQTPFARILVEAVGNIFLDINDKNFAITAPVSIAENTIDGESINVFPQPAGDVTNIAFSGSLRGEIALTLTDATGRIVLEQTVFKSSVSLIQTIDISNFSRGIYFIRMDTSQGKVARKVIKL